MLKPIQIVAIHQPNFFPWLGYFDKIKRADIFVYLDHTYNNPRTASWYKRVKILLNQQEYWLSLALKSGSQIFMPLQDIYIDKPLIQKEKHLKTILLNYRKHPFFEEVFELIEKYYQHPSELLVERNISFIDTLCNQLQIHTPKVRSSSLNCEKNSTELLIEITQKLEAYIYMAGGGAGGYQEDEKFKESNITLIYQNFQHPTYAQMGSNGLVTGLSIIDALMNLGFEGTKKLL